MLDYIRNGLADAVEKKASTAHCSLQMAAREIERLRTDLEQINRMPTFKSMSAEDWIRLRDWMIDPGRKKARTAFTAGPARERPTHSSRHWR